MALKKILYPLDLSGTRVSNRIEEAVVIGSSQYRAFALKTGPFYTDDLKVYEKNDLNTPLVRGLDYECVYYYDQISKLTGGLEICGVIVVHNPKVSTDLVVAANIVGGPFTASAEAIDAAITNLELDNRNTHWKNVIDKPDLWQPPPHLHDIGDVFGFEYIIDILGAIRDTMMIGDNQQYLQIRKRIQELEEALTKKVNDHMQDKADPHNVTNHQVNAYTREEIDRFIAAIEADFDDLEPRFRSVIDAIAAINDRIDGLIQSVAANGRSIVQTNSELSRQTRLIADINDAIDDINQEIIRIDGELEALRRKDADLQAQLSSNDQELDALRQVNNDQQNDISKLREDLSSLDSESSQADSSLSTRLSLLEGSKDDYLLRTAVNWGGASWGAVINKVPQVQSNGVMEIGKYIDFHDTNTSSDYSARLYISGTTMYTSNNLSVNDCYIRSDIRYKTNLEEIPLDEVNSALMNMGGAYRYDLTKTGESKIGQIAQHVERAFPEAVDALDDEDERFKRLAISEPAILAMLVSGYKHQGGRITQLEDIIAKQEKIIAKLVAKLNIEIED